MEVLLYVRHKARKGAVSRSMNAWGTAWPAWQADRQTGTRPPASVRRTAGL